MAPSEQSVSQEGIIPVSDLVKRLRPLVNASCNLDNGESGESCLKGTPLIALHRATVTAILQHLTEAAADEGLAALLGELLEDLFKINRTVHGNRVEKLSRIDDLSRAALVRIDTALSSRGQA